MRDERFWGLLVLALVAMLIAGTSYGCYVLNYGPLKYGYCQVTKDGSNTWYWEKCK